MKYIIIVAGGSGTRMGTEIAKQFIEIGGKPILIHTIEQFLRFSPAIQVILVLPEKDFSTWNNISQQYHSLIHSFTHSLIVVNGGASRFQSVKNGLNQIKAENGFVAVHDGVRPFVTLDTIKKGFEMAEKNGTAVTCVSLKDSARMVLADGNNVAVNRQDYRLVQTPQTFELNLMRKAFETPEQPFFTDCASVLEAAGEKITLIEGDYTNIKITTPEDLAWAEVLLKS